MCGFLAYLTFYLWFYPGLSGCTACFYTRWMFEQTEIDLIAEIELLPENIRYSKHSCVALLKIRIGISLVILKVLLWILIRICEISYCAYILIWLRGIRNIIYGSWIWRLRVRLFWSRFWGFSHMTYIFYTINRLYSRWL